MLQQSAQASCFPIGEERVSRHQKIIIIGQAITTGATSIHSLSTNLAGGWRHSLLLLLNECYVSFPAFPMAGWLTLLPPS